MKDSVRVKMQKLFKFVLSLLISNFLMAGNIYDKQHNEPLTTKISSSDPEWIKSVQNAQKTLNIFLKLYQEYKDTEGVSFLIKVPLKYGNNTSHFWYIFKGRKNNKLCGKYFELPKELMKYKNIQVDDKEVEDWMINDHGHLYGGYSLRLQRKRLPEDERKSFDKYIGIKVYENNDLLK